MIEQTCTAARPSSVGHAVAAAGAAVARMVRAIRREMEIAKARRALEAMPDAMLRDIGIDRFAIDHAARLGRGTRAGRRP